MFGLKLSDKNFSSLGNERTGKVGGDWKVMFSFLFLDIVFCSSLITELENHVLCRKSKCFVEWAAAVRSQSACHVGGWGILIKDGQWV